MVNLCFYYGDCYPLIQIARVEGQKKLSTEHTLSIMTISQRSTAPLMSPSAPFRINGTRPRAHHTHISILIIACRGSRQTKGLNVTA